MARKYFALMLAATLVLSGTGWAQAVFGTRVVINGLSSDVALDESRGVVYVSNFSARRVDVVGIQSLRVERSINLDLNQPSAIDVSPDSRYLVVAHYGNNATTVTQTNGLTVIDLARDTRRTYSLSAAPFGLAFGANGKALIATATSFLLFDPATGTSSLLANVGTLRIPPTVLPVTVPNLPPNITRASVNSSADRNIIAGLTDAFSFRYDVNRNDLSVSGYVSEPLQAPRAVSLSKDGSLVIAGWFITNTDGRGYQFPGAGGDLPRGSHVIDSQRNRAYAQIFTNNELPNGPNDKVLKVMDADNLNVLMRLRLPENLAGKSVITSDSSRVFSMSESGLVMLPIGELERTRRIVSDSIVSFRGNFCDRRAVTRDITIRDLSGAGSRFSVSAPGGVQVSPSSGVTPAVVRVTVDPTRFAAAKGTTLTNLTITSPDAVNFLEPVRLAINTREPDQKGTTVDVGGELTGIQGDSQRNRFYILQASSSEVLAYDAATLRVVGRLKTGTTPTSIAMTFDRSRLLIGHDNSTFVEVYNLDTLEREAPILAYAYPRQVASSASGTLVANRVAGPIHTIGYVDMTTRRVIEFPSLGPWRNDINLDTAAVSSANGSSILFTQPNGSLIHWQDGEFVAAKQLPQTLLSGGIAASNFGLFAVGNRLFNGSLTEVGLLDAGNGATTGFMFVGQDAIRTQSANASGPGVIERVESSTGNLIRPTRMVEAPTMSSGPSVFIKNLVMVNDKVISLTTSGFTVLPINYDDATAPPKIERVVNAADFSQAVAPGSLVTIFGSRLSPAAQASTSLPLPTVLGESCLQVNGLPVPFLYVSDGQINAQLPNQAVGNVNLVLRTPGGVSDTFPLVIGSTAPSVFRTATDGTRNDLPTILRADNGEPVTGSNPVRRDGRLIVYLTGLGLTSPEVSEGQAAPSSPLARAVIAPRVLIGGTEAVVEFAGLAPGTVGVYQMNIFVPNTVPTGLSIPLTITQGSASTSVDVRVVR